MTTPDGGLKARRAAWPVVWPQRVLGLPLVMMILAAGSTRVGVSRSCRTRPHYSSHCGSASVLHHRVTGDVHRRDSHAALRLRRGGSSGLQLAEHPRGGVGLHISATPQSSSLAGWSELPSLRPSRWLLPSARPSRTTASFAQSTWPALRWLLSPPRWPAISSKWRAATRARLPTDLTDLVWDDILAVRAIPGEPGILLPQRQPSPQPHRQAVATRVEAPERRDHYQRQ
jgi:hypothetical protein